MLVAVAACGGKTVPGPGGSPAAGAAAAQGSLDGTWADEIYTLTIAGADYTLRERLPCGHLPCATARVRTGTWSRDGTALHLATTYDLGFDDGGETMVLVPVAVAADHQPTLRLRRLRLPPLAGTAWDSGDGHRIAFSDGTFTRVEPCADCADPISESHGTYTLEEGELALDWDGANESFDVRYEDGALVLIGATETVRYAPVTP